MDIFPTCALRAQTLLLPLDLARLLLALTHTQALPTRNPPVESTSRPPPLTLFIRLHCFKLSAGSAVTFSSQRG